jgi:hypothetical protein
MYWVHTGIQNTWQSTQMLCERRGYLNDRTGCSAPMGIHDAPEFYTEFETIIVTSQRDMLRRNDDAQTGSVSALRWIAELL